MASNETLEILEPAVVVDKCIDIVSKQLEKNNREKKRIMENDNLDWTVNPKYIANRDVRFALKDALTQMLTLKTLIGMSENEVSSLEDNI